MGDKLSVKTRNIIVVCVFIVNLVAFGIISNINRLHGGGDVYFGSVAIPCSTLSGTIQSVALFLCIVSVCLRHRFALILSYVYFVISTISMIMQILVMGQLGVVPGIFNMMISILTVTIISDQIESIKLDRITDSVTKLPNRIGIQKVIDKTIAKGKPFAVVSVQIVNFKSVRDDIGHARGEEILREVGRRMKTTVGERGVVSRFDGAEFSVVLYASNVDTVTKHIISAISKKITLRINDVDTNYYLDVRAGVSEYPKNATVSGELIKCADIALSHASKDVNHKYRFYNSEMEVEIKERTDIISKIKLSLENDYFYLVYQPQFTSNRKKLRGFETLIRMKLPDGTIVSPGKFIEAAERTGLIVQLDKYVLRKAMTEFATVFKKKNYDFILSINVSAHSMAEATFFEDVKTMITKIGFPASKLELEITEYSIGASDSYTEKNIDAFRNLGVKFALDDFGTGYTSLSRLMNLKVDLLKIDKSLIDNISSTEENRALVDSVIYMGHLMKCEVIAEGVEEENQLSAIRDCKCDLVQGYIWGRPEPFEKAMDIIRSQEAG